MSGNPEAPKIPKPDEEPQSPEASQSDDESPSPASDPEEDSDSEPGPENPRPRPGSGGMSVEADEEGRRVTVLADNLRSLMNVLGKNIANSNDLQKQQLANEKLNIPLFTGSFSQDVDEWLERFELLANTRAVPWTDETKRVKIIDYLDGAAFTYVSTLSKDSSWQKVKSVMITRFRIQPQTLSERLLNLRQKPKESVEEFANRVARVYKGAVSVYDGLGTGFQRDVFLSGLLPYLKQKVELREFKTLEMAVTFVKRVEAAKMNSDTFSMDTIDPPSVNYSYSYSYSYFCSPGPRGILQLLH